MKKSILALLLLQASFSVNATAITVEGFGSDTEAAKRDAFRTAIENVCGTVVLSDREHNNQYTVRNNVITYSSCNVQKYTILEQSNGRIKLSVDVQPNNIAQRLQQTSENKHSVDQGSLQAQVETSKTQQSARKQMLDEIFVDYPSRAFNLKTTVDIVQINNNSYQLNVQYEMNWNYDFIKSLIDVFDSIKTKAFFDRNVYVNYKKPDSSFSHKDVFLLEPDNLFFVASYFKNNDILIQTDMKDSNGQIILSKCNKFYDNVTKDLFEFVNQVNPYNQPNMITYLRISGDASIKRSMSIPLSSQASKIYDISISLTKKCR